MKVEGSSGIARSKGNGGLSDGFPESSEQRYVPTRMTAFHLPGQVGPCPGEEEKTGTICVSSTPYPIGWDTRASFSVSVDRVALVYACCFPLDEAVA